MTTTPRLTIVGQLLPDHIVEEEGSPDSRSERSAVTLADRQGPVPLLLEHLDEYRVGRLVFAERAQRGAVWAVFVCDADAVDGYLDHHDRLSVAYRGIPRRAVFAHKMYRDVTLEHVGLVAHPDADNPPVLIAKGDVTDGSCGTPWSFDTYPQALLRRAIAHRRAGGYRRDEVLIGSSYTRATTTTRAAADNHPSTRRPPVYRPAPRRGPDGLEIYYSAHPGRVLGVR